MGYLTGSDGGSIMIKDEHINNRRSDPERNWGLPDEQHRETGGDAASAVRPDLGRNLFAAFRSRLR